MRLNIKGDPTMPTIGIDEYLSQRPEIINKQITLGRGLYFLLSGEFIEVVCSVGSREESCNLIIPDDSPSEIKQELEEYVCQRNKSQ